MSASHVRGGPSWAGFAIALATWILFELLLFAIGIGGLAANAVENADTATWWWSGIAAILAFFLGGLVAGASSVWDHITDGVLQGTVVWAMIVVGLLLLSAAGVGIGFGVVGDVLATAPEAAAGESSVVEGAQDGAGAAALALTATLIAAAAGGAVGAKMWPGRRDDVIDLP